MKKRTRSIGGWKYTLKSTSRRRSILLAFPKRWTLNHKYLIASRNLRLLANRTSIKRLRLIALADAKYFSAKHKKK